MISLLFAGVDKSDPRIQSAYKWITTNYTLENNPGTDTKHGLFYFYNAFAKVMAAYGDVEFTDGKGQTHNWRNELAQKLLSLQAPGRLVGQQGLEQVVGEQPATRHRVDGDSAGAGRPLRSQAADRRLSHGPPPAAAALRRVGRKDGRVAVSGRRNSLGPACSCGR